MVKPKAPLKLVSSSGALRDLAIFRASDIDLAAVVPPETVDVRPPNDSHLENSLKRSYEFVREARAVVNMYNKGVVDTEGGKVEEVRGKLEDVLNGLSD